MCVYGHEQSLQRIIFPNMLVVTQMVANKAFQIQNSLLCAYTSSGYSQYSARELLQVCNVIVNVNHEFT